MFASLATALYILIATKVFSSGTVKTAKEFSGINSVFGTSFHGLQPTLSDAFFQNCCVLCAGISFGTLDWGNWNSLAFVKPD